MTSIVDLSQWSYLLNPNQYDVQVGGLDYYVENADQTYSLTSPSADVARFQVDAGDTWSNDPTTKNRSEISGTTVYAPGTQVNVSYGFEIEPGLTNTASWLVTGQFHQVENNGYSPPFEINFNGNDHMGIAVNYLTSSGAQAYKQLWTDPSNIVRGHEYQMQIEATFDQGTGTGHLLVIRDGVTLVNYTGPMGFPGMSGVYWKEGLYRSADSVTMAADYSNLSVTTGSSAPPTPPTTAAESYAAKAGAALSVSAAQGVLAKDVDHNGQTLHAALATNGGPAHGSLVLNADGSFTYTPTAGYAGTDSFTYIASDSVSSSSPTTVTLNVAASAPTIQAASYGAHTGQALTENAAQGVLSVDTDNNGLTLHAALAANGGPAHGTLALNADGSFIYTPTAGFVGTDSFTYIASDSLSAGAPTTVTLNVAGGAPTAVASSYAAHAAQTLTEDAAHGVLVGATDPNGLALTAALAANGGPAHGTVVLNADGSFTYTPTTGFAGTDSFTYIASDSVSSSSPTTVTLNVAANAPTTQAASYSAHAGQVLVETAAQGVLSVDTDNNGLTLTAALAANGGPAHGTVALNADGSFTYTPTTGFAGTDSFTYIASDSLSAGAPTTVTLNVVDPPPTTTPGAYSIAGDVSTSVTAAQGVLAGDVDNNGLALSAALAQNGGPQHGALTLNADGSFTYTPTQGYVGTDSFTYVASDSLGSSAPTTVTLTVAPQHIVGGTGNDTYYVYNSADQVIVAAGTPNETVVADSNYVLPANIQHLILNGSGLTGTVNAAGDTITSQGGPNTLVGNANNITFYVNNIGDQVAMQSGHSGDMVASTVSYVMPTNVVSMQLVGTGLTATANAAGGNYISSINGGNTLIGSAKGGDTFTVSHSNDIIVAPTTATNDTVDAYSSYALPANVANLVGKGSNAITLVGNSLNNVITANTGADTLTGGGGTDTFVIGTADKIETITDFSAGDKINISAFKSAGLTPTFTDHGSFSTISFSNGDAIELLGVHASSLSVQGHYVV